MFIKALERNCELIMVCILTAVTTWYLTRRFGACNERFFLGAQDPVQGEYVIHVNRNVSNLCRPGCGCTGGMDAAGNFDMSNCCDAVWNACYPLKCAGANCLHGDAMKAEEQAAKA